MKLTWCFLAMGVGLTATSSALAEDMAASGKWRVSGGISVRSVDTDLHLRAPSALSITRDPGGMGDVGFYTGSGILLYEDGQLGPSYEEYDGTCYGVIGSASQLRPTGRPYNVEENAYYEELTFHSSYSYNETTYSASPYHGSDDQTVVAPFVQVRRDLGEFGGVSIGGLVGYTFVKSDASSGLRQLAQQGVNRRTVTYAYTYDHVGQYSGASDPGATFPFVDDGAYTVFDVPFSNSEGWSSEADSPALDPRKSMSTALRGRSLYIAQGSADTELTLHEVLLAPEVSMALGKRLVVGLSAGPTINFIDAELEAQRSWSRNGVTVQSEHSKADSSDVEIGLAVDLSLSADVTDRIFCQVSAGYRYVPSIKLDAGIASTEIDASSIQGSIGVGVRL